MKEVLCFFLMFYSSISILVAQNVKGSDTVLPVSQIVAESFLEQNSSGDITVIGGGTGVGFSSLMNGTCDIAMASREISFSEKMKFRKEHREIIEKVIARDALAVVVNPANKVNKLTRKQLEQIFRGKITNWKDVGGDNLKIIVYSRETSSGTYEFFKESVLDGKNYMSGSLSMPATGAIIQSVAQTKGAIGYVGLAYINKKVKSLAVSYDDRNYSYPTVENALSGKYPIVRPLFYYYDKVREKKVSPFINYMLSPKGQKLIMESGYIPVK